MFLRWIWYASRRAGLHLDEAEDDFATPERVEKALRIIAPTLRLSQADQEQLLPHARITRYGADETLQFAGQVPKRMTFIVNGQVRLIATATTASLIPSEPWTRATSSARPRSPGSRSRRPRTPSAR